MKFKALKTFVIFHEQMHVCNAGTEHDLPEELIAGHIETGMAEPVTAKKGKAKAAPEPAAEEAPDAPVADEDAPPA